MTIRMRGRSAGPQRAHLERVADELGLGAVVSFLGTRHDIPELLSALDLFLLTSHTEANPVSVLEAMSVGLPVVATRVGSVAESIAEGVTGFLAEPQNTDELATHVVRLMQDQQTAAGMGAVGRESVLRRWSLEQMVRGYENLIATTYRQKRASRCRQSSVWRCGISPQRPTV